MGLSSLDLLSKAMIDVRNPELRNIIGNPESLNHVDEMGQR